MTFDGTGRLFENHELEKILARVYSIKTHMEHTGTLGVETNYEAIKDSLIEQVSEIVRNTFSDISERWSSEHPCTVRMESENRINALSAALSNVNAQKVRLQIKNECIREQMENMRRMIKNMEMSVDAEMEAENDELRKELAMKDRNMRQMQAMNDELLQTLSKCVTCAVKDRRISQLEESTQEMRDDIQRLMKESAEQQRNAEKERMSKTNALLVLQDSYSELLQNSMEKLAGTQPMNTRKIGEIRKWYQMELEKNERLHAQEREQTFKEWNLNFGDLVKRQQNSEHRALMAEKQLSEKQEQIVQYRMLWHHFFGIDAPLKYNLSRVNDTLTEIESKLHVPFTRGGRTPEKPLLISDLSACNRSPLKIGEVPLNSNDTQSFHLYNNTMTDVCFHQCFLSNGTALQTHMLPSRVLKKGQAFSCFMGRPMVGEEEQQMADIVLDPDFCNFSQFRAKLYLCDSCHPSTEVLLFPNEVEDILNVDGYSNILETTKMRFDAHSTLCNWTGFEFSNIRGKPIRFLNCIFIVIDVRNGHQICSPVDIPSFVIPVNGNIRVLTGTLKGNVNDILLPMDEFHSGEQLELRDSDGGSIILYTQP